MANTGNIFPGTGENNAGIGATAWTSPTNIVSDNTTDATCNAAASSQYLVARNFGFSIPAGAVIGGIVVRVEASEHSTSTESLNAQLQNSSLIGSSKAQTVNGTTKAVYTYGATNDVWGATLTPSIVNDANFGVRVWFTTAHDVRVDYITIAVEYTEPIVVSPGVGQVIVTGLAPTVDISDNKTISPGVGAVVVTGFAPTIDVTANVQVDPGVANVQVNGFAPTVQVSDHKVIEPGVGEVLITGFAPEIIVSDHKVVSPGVAGIIVTGFAPTIDIGNATQVNPGVAEVLVTGFAPTVEVSDHKVINPGTAELIVTGFAPTIDISSGQSANVSPGVGQIIITGFAPTIEVTAEIQYPVLNLTSSIGQTVTLSSLFRDQELQSRIENEINKDSNISQSINLRSEV